LEQRATAAQSEREAIRWTLPVEAMSHIGTFRTWQVWLTMSVVEGKADFQLRIQTSEFDPLRT
jgi:subtilisin-like proprotein convertase family protein